MAELESRLITKCNAEWKPRTFALTHSLTPNASEYGRTTIIPAIFDDHNGVRLVTWRQLFTTAGHQLLMTGSQTGYTIPEDIKVAWAGIALPNKNQHLTEIRFQIGDRKYGRVDLEEIHLYNKPAIIFEEGLVIDEEESFDLHGYIEGTIPIMHDGYTGVWQRIVFLGSTYYKFYDKVGGNCGAAIT